MPANEAPELFRQLKVRYPPRERPDPVKRSTLDDLLTGEKTAVIIHAGADNFGNIPRDRYYQTNGTPGPDETTMSTGDAGKRVACGVIGAG